jgi:hypothetical protein
MFLYFTAAHKLMEYRIDLVLLTHARKFINYVVKCHKAPPVIKKSWARSTCRTPMSRTATRWL